MILNVVLFYVLGMAITIGAKILIDFDVTSLSLFFVVPVGAMVVGWLMGNGLPRGMFKRNIKKSQMTLAISLMLGALFYLSIQYGYYQITYIEDGEFNYKLKGDHVSEFQLPETDERVNFINFTKYKVDSQVISFSRRYVRPIGSIEGNKIVNWGFFILEILGFMAGIYYAYKLKVDKYLYCDDCRLYMKSKKKLFRITENVAIGGKMIMEALELGDADGVKELIQNAERKASPSGNRYLEGTLYNCEQCNSGYMVFETYFKGNKGKYELKNEMTRTVYISRAIVSQLINMNYI